MKIVAVVPTISPDLPALSRLVESLAEAGVDVRVVANSQRASRLLSPLPMHVFDAGSNLGFGESVRSVISDTAWDWVLIVNDDFTVGDTTPAGIVSTLAALSPNEGIVHFAEEELRRYPSRGSVFASLSLINRVARRLRFGTRLAPSRPSEEELYRSFSFVGLSHRSWEDIGGFDPKLIFTYEDADYVRRASLKGYVSVSRPLDGYQHSHSVSSGKFVRWVLPVSAYSAVNFLDTWHPGRVANRATVVVALLCRIPLAALSKAPLREHLVGALRAIGYVITNKQPHLPEYDRVN